jgi:membrane protease YdiL (CAAX protease family)
MLDERNTEIRSYLDWSDKGKASLVRYLAGTILVLFVFLVLSGLGQFPIILLFPDYKNSLVLSTVALLLSFVISFFAIPLIVRLVHQRPYWSVAMPRPAFEGWNFLAGLLVGLIMGLAAGLLFHVTGLLPIESNPAFNLGTWLALAAIGFVGIFIQAGAEELLFRGYLTQFVRRFSANPLFFIGIPMVLFAVPHIANVASLGGGPLAMIPYLLAGWLYAWAAYRTGSLWMGLGLHLANNYSGLALVGTKGDVLPSAAPFQVESPGLAVGVAAVAVQTVLIAAVLVYLLRRRDAAAAPLAARSA